MAEKRCYYEVLGVARDSSQPDIARAYRKLAIKYHPDSNPNDETAIAQFKEVAEAYEVLNDSDKRRRYDQFGHAGVQQQGGGGHDMEDIFEHFGEMFRGTIFDDFFGGGGRGRGRARRGADVRCDITLTLEEAAAGAKKEVKLVRHSECQTCSGSGAAPGSSPEVCRRCRGQGQVVQATGILRVQTTCPACRGSGKTISNPCKDCDGSGAQPKEVRLEVPIPAGIDDGMRVRLTGQGQPSPDGGPPGDAYCFIHVKAHPLFRRDGNDLQLQVPISYAQAALGTTVEVPTLEGAKELTIPNGTQSGDVFRIRGMGMPDPHSGRRGDLLVHTFIEVPKKLSTRQEELLRELASLDHDQVTPHRKSFLERIRDYFVGQAEAKENAAKEEEQ
jgi:molecular chaperone DnaJ